MPKAKRPISIYIPEEMQLTENEIASIDHAIKLQLAVVAAPGDVELPDSPINTTKLPVEVMVIGPKMKASSRKPSRKPRSKKPSRKRREPGK